MRLVALTPALVEIDQCPQGFGQPMNSRSASGLAGHVVSVAFVVDINGWIDIIQHRRGMALTKLPKCTACGFPAEALKRQRVKNGKVERSWTVVCACFDIIGYYRDVPTALRVWHDSKASGRFNHHYEFMLRCYGSEKHISKAVKEFAKTGIVPPPWTGNDVVLDEATEKFIRMMLERLKRNPRFSGDSVPARPDE